MSDNLVTFNFQETEPNTKTFYSRLTHFLEVTDPKYFFIGNQEILDGVNIVKKYKL